MVDEGCAGRGKGRGFLTEDVFWKGGVNLLQWMVEGKVAVQDFWGALFNYEMIVFSETRARWSPMSPIQDPSGKGSQWKTCPLFRVASTEMMAEFFSDTGTTFRHKGSG